jgi:hypothetical protein
MNSIAKTLYDAKNEAGEKAVEAAKAGDHDRAYEWRTLAIDIDNLAYRALKLTAA